VPSLIEWCGADAASRPEPRRPPPVPGFVESEFNPLVHLVLREAIGDRDAGRDTGVLLGSVAGDTTTADVASRNLLSGRVRNPLLFYQSIPNSILGYVSRQLGLTGPMACVAGAGTLLPDLLEMADLWLDRPGVRRVVVVDVELAANPRSEAAYAGGERPQAFDAAVAVVLTREPERAGEPTVILRELRAAKGPATATAHAWGGLGGLLDLCVAAERLRRGEPPATAVVVDASGPRPVEVRLDLAPA
jgi:hypothetical protein